jgi:16S rRNA (uracil1498-N3)-methyltransferase
MDGDAAPFTSDWNEYGMSRFFAPIVLTVGQTVSLPETIFHHWVRVLRAQVGDQATLFHGQGGEFLVTLTEISKKSAMVRVESFDPIDRTPSTQVTLGQVMSKGDRMDYAIQKATELGVHQIQLLISERCEMRLKYDRDQKKIEHWQQVAIAACEQCGMNRIPQILPPLPLEDWLQTVDQPRRFVMSLSSQPVQPNFADQRPACVLVGPEGGLSEAEIVQCEQAGFVRWQLGQRVLRTETAPIVALAYLTACDSFI